MPLTRPLFADETHLLHHISCLEDTCAELEHQAGRLAADLAHTRRKVARLEAELSLATRPPAPYVPGPGVWTHGILQPELFAA